MSGFFGAWIARCPVGSVREKEAGGLESRCLSRSRWPIHLGALLSRHLGVWASWRLAALAS